MALSPNAQRVLEMALRTMSKTNVRGDAQVPTFQDFLAANIQLASIITSELAILTSTWDANFAGLATTSLPDSEGADDQLIAAIQPKDLVTWVGVNAKMVERIADEIARLRGAWGSQILHSKLGLDDGTNPHGTTFTDVGAAPTLHAAQHTDGTDDIQDATASQKGLMTAIFAALMAFYYGTFLEEYDALITENAGEIVLSLEKAGGSGGDLTMVFSDGPETLDCTPALTIDTSAGTPAASRLTAGSQASPTTNYVYILQSDATPRTLKTSTSGMPSGQHIPVAILHLPTAALVASLGGAFVNQNINQGTGVDNQGDLSHIGEVIRAGGAKYIDGLDLTITLSAGNTVVDIAMTAGRAFQFHRHAFPAFDTGSGGVLLILNQDGAANDDVTNPELLVNDANGNPVSSGGKRYFNWHFIVVGNKTGQFSPVLVQLSTGSYVKLSDARKDTSGFDVRDVPEIYHRTTTTGFIVYRVTMSFRASDSTWTHEATDDLRLSSIDQIVGGIGTPQVEFAANVFRAFDENSLFTIAFALAALTANRTLTFPDQDINFGLILSAAAVIADNAVPRGDGGARGLQGSTVLIADTGVVSIPAIGDGGVTNYDLRVGTTGTPTYGIIQFGNAIIGRTSFNAASIDLDGAVIIRNVGGPVTGNIEFLVTESTGNTCRFALPKSGVGLATYNPRSMIIAGPAPADTAFVTIGYWQGQGIFDNLVMDTVGSGAELGVQGACEIEGILYINVILESTTAAGVTIETVLLKDGLVDGRDVAADGTTLDTRVAAHAMLDGSVHTDSVADGVTRGSIIIGNSTPNWDELVLGSSGAVLKSDGTDIAWGSAYSQSFSVQALKITGDDITQGVQIDAGDRGWRALADDSTDEQGVIQGRMEPGYLGGTLTFQILLSMVSAQTGDKDVKIDVEVMALTSGDAVDVNTDSYAAAQSVTHDLANAQPAGYVRLLEVTFTQAQADGINSGDYFRIRINRDTSVAADATGDVEYLALGWHE